MTAPTFPTSDGRRGARAGFTLIELTLALLVMGLIAVLMLPRVMPGRTDSALRASAYSVAAMLRSDRATAATAHRETLTVVDPQRREVRSSAGGVIALPSDTDLAMADGAPGVRFRPDGSASGGLVVLARGGGGYGVRVSAFSGAVDIVKVKR